MSGRKAAERHRGDGSDPPFFGFACGEFGSACRLSAAGAAAICATFIPSALVYYGLLPDGGRVHHEVL
ncbi:MAG: hypothetical protein ACLR9P_00795 [Escherichia coli]